MPFGGHRVWNWDSPGGVAMQSVHACAGFLKVGPFGTQSPAERLRDPISAIWAVCWAALGNTLRPEGTP